MKTNVTNDRSDIIASNILLIGIVIASIFMATGLVLYILDPSTAVNVVTTPLNKIPNELKNLNPVAFFSAGIFTVILTPVMRVISLIFSFLQNKEYKYFLISFMVLCIMTISYILATKGS